VNFTKQKAYDLLTLSRPMSLKATIVRGTDNALQCVIYAQK